MKVCRLAAALASAVFLGGGALAEPLSVEDLAKVPNIAGLSMSQEGDFVIGVIAAPGANNENQALAVWDLDGEIDVSKPLVPTRITPPNSKMRFLGIGNAGATALKKGMVIAIATQPWTGQTRCLEGGGAGAVRTFVTKVFIGTKAIDDLTTDIAGIGGERIRDKQIEQCRELNNTVGVASSLPLDPSNVLVRYFDIADSETRYYKVNVETNRREFMYTGAGTGDIDYIDPRDGTVLTRQDIEPMGGDYRIDTLIRDASGAFVREEPLSYMVSQRYQMSVLGRDEASGQYYILTDKFADKAEIYFYDPVTDQFSSEPLFAHPQFSAGGVILGTKPSNWNQPLGFTYLGATTKVYWIDPEMRSITEGLEQAFPNRNINILDYNDDKSRILFSTSSSVQAPTFFLLVDKSKLAVFGASRPWIEADQLRETEFIYYPARDELQIPGFLTLPKGWTKEQGPIPAVVLPHGGPWARDSADWDESGWPQFLASRGYAVLQPQYRGSTGFGRELWLAGDGEWGQKMQDDKDDGAKWLVEQGIADPGKMAIFGYSYGGFAAFAAAVREDGPFRCAIGGAGVANLALFNKIVSESRIRRVVQGNTIRGMDPMKNLDKVNIPVLVYHGDRDVRVPISEGRGFYDGIKKSVPAKFVEIDDMPHSLPWWPDHHRESLNAIDDFLANDCGFRS